MSRIRQNYFFPPRTWRVAALRCSSAAWQFSLRDPSQLLQRRPPAHSALYLVRELNCPEIVSDPRSKAHRSRQC
jgi:hypothetical protein